MQNLRQRIYLMLGSLLIAVLALGWIKTRVLPTVSDASRIVIAAADSDSKQTYIGVVETVTTYHGKQMRISSRVYHTPTAERIEYAGGPLGGSIAVSRGPDSALCKPGHEAIVTKTVSPISQSHRLALLLKNYSAAAAGETTVANQLCYIIYLVPREGNGPTRRLWIDKRTHIALRNDEMDHAGNLVSSSRFVKISYPKTIPARLLAVPVAMSGQPASEPMNCDKLSGRLGFKVDLPKHMAEGYVFENSCLYRCTCNCGHQSAHLIYTNGMDTVSVFETATLARCGGKTCDLKGGIKAADCAINSGEQDGVAVTRKKNKMVVVVGDLNGSELMRIARSIP
jgi:negative regulator of sigma E activity